MLLIKKSELSELSADEYRPRCSLIEKLNKTRNEVARPNMTGMLRIIHSISFAHARRMYQSVPKDDPKFWYVRIENIYNYFIRVMGDRGWGNCPLPTSKV